MCAARSHRYGRQGAAPDGGDDDDGGYGGYSGYSGYGAGSGAGAYSDPNALSHLLETGRGTPIHLKKKMYKPKFYCQKYYA